MNKYICSAKTQATEDTWDCADGVIVWANNGKKAAFRLAKDLFYANGYEKLYAETVLESKVEKWVVEVSTSFQTVKDVIVGGSISFSVVKGWNDE